MNKETEKTASSAGGHPDENQLLLALERELSPKRQQKSNNISETAGVAARDPARCRVESWHSSSREKRYLPSLEPPPQDFGNFLGKLRGIADEGKPDGLALRIWRSIWRFVTSSNQVRWVSATAAIMVVVIFWTQVLFNPPAVSASEFLVRAIAAQNPGTRKKIM